MKTVGSACTDHFTSISNAVSLFNVLIALILIVIFFVSSGKFIPRLPPQMPSVPAYRTEFP
jgi:hypothetical protein